MNRSPTTVISLMSAGGSTSAAALDFAHQLPSGARILIAEFPCLGLPQLAHYLPSSFTPHINQWLQELDHHPGASIEPYLHRDEGIDIVCMHPSVMLDQPVSCMLAPQTLLQAPLEVRRQLASRYDYMIWLCQGTMMHPMTHAALRNSDAIVMVGEGKASESYAKCFFTPFEQDYGGSMQRMFCTANVHFDWAMVLQTTQDIDPVLPFSPSVDSAVFHSADHRTTSVPSTSIQPEMDGWFLTDPADDRSGQLSFGLSQEQPYATFDPPGDLLDLQLYLRVKQLLCEQGIQSANQLVLLFGVRRRRILLILQQLAAEGMIHTLGKGRTYAMQWSTKQQQSYLANTQPVPIPVPRRKGG